MLRVVNKAYNRLFLPDGSSYPNVIVTFSEDGQVLSWHAFSHEEPFTLWVGGDYVLNENITD